MNRGRRLLSNAGIIGVGMMASKLIVFLLMPLYTTWLTTGEYGAVEVSTGLSNFLIPLAAVGVSTGIFRFAAEREADKTAVFSSSIALLGVGLGAFLILSPLLFLIDYCREYVWLVVLYVFFADLQAVTSQYLRAIDRMTLFAGQGILNTALTVVFNLVFLLGFDMGVTGYVLSVVIGNALTTLFIVLRARLWTVFCISKIQKSLMWQILRFSLPLIPTTVCWLITDLSDRAMVTYFWSEELTGIYSAAYKIPTLVNLVAGVFLQAWQFSAIFELKDREKCLGFYSNVFSSFIAVITVGCAGLLLVSRHFTALLLNPAYWGANTYMPALLCAVAAEAIVSFLASVYLVQKRSDHSFYTALLGALSNVVMNLILIPVIGALGAAIATCASYLLVMAVRLIDVKKLLPFRVYPIRLLVSLAVLLGSAVVMTLELPLMYLWVALGFLLILAVNARALLVGIRAIFIREQL